MGLRLRGAVVGDEDWVLDAVLALPAAVVDSGMEAVGAGVGNRPFALQEGTGCTPDWVDKKAPLDAACAHLLPCHVAAAVDSDTPEVGHRLLAQSGEAAAVAATFALPFAVLTVGVVDRVAAVAFVHKGFESRANRAWYCHHGSWLFETASCAGSSMPNAQGQLYAVAVVGARTLY